MAVPAVVAIVLGALGVAAWATRRKKAGEKEWGRLADSASELEHATGRVKYELKDGTRASLHATMRKLNAAIASAPAPDLTEFPAETYAKFREKYLNPAAYLLERAIDTLADMKSRGIKRVRALRQFYRDRPAAGIESTKDRM